MAHFGFPAIPQIGTDYPHIQLDEQSIRGFFVRCDDNGDGIFLTELEFSDSV